MRRTRQIERRGQFGERARRGALGRFLMHEERAQVLLRVLLHQREVFAALAALRDEHAHALTFDLGEPRFDQARVVGQRLDHDLFRNRRFQSSTTAGPRFQRDRSLLVARAAQRKRGSGRLGVERGAHAEISRSRRVELFEELGEELGVARVGGGERVGIAGCGIAWRHRSRRGGFP